MVVLLGFIMDNAYSNFSRPSVEKVQNEHKETAVKATGWSFKHVSMSG